MQSNKIKQQQAKLLALFIVIGLLIIASTILLWLFLPVKIIEYKGQYKIQEVVYQGDETAYEVKYCKYVENKPEILQKMFVDGLVFNAEENKAEFHKGCYTQVIELKIPSTLPAGKYKLRTVATYRINPLRTVTYTNETNWFQVKSHLIEQIKSKIVIKE
jgi:hypothetical protein